MDELLKLLRKDALESTEDLARMLGIPEADVKARMAEYKARGLVRGFLAIVNEDLLDDERVRAVIEVRCTPEREGGFDRVGSRVSKFPEVRSLFLMSGTYDLMALVEGSSLREVALFVAEKLATIEGVMSTATHFVLKSYKEHGVLMRMEEKDERLKVTPSAGP